MLDIYMKLIEIEEKKETPKWLWQIMGNQGWRHLHDNCFGLTNIAEEMLHVDIRNILTNSCFYYCAGRDITPIMALENYIHSFIYCDNCMYQKYDESLYIFKQKLRINDYIEIQKINIDLEYFKLNNENMEKIIRSLEMQPFDTLLSKGEFSIWEKNGHLYSIFYLCWDDICVWNNLYKKHLIYPTVICNIAPESSLLRWDSCDENNLPKYVIGYGHHISESYNVIGEVEYFGDYGGPSTLWKI